MINIKEQKNGINCNKDTELLDGSYSIYHITRTHDSILNITLIPIKLYLFIDIYLTNFKQFSLRTRREDINPLDTFFFKFNHYESFESFLIILYLYHI